MKKMFLFFMMVLAFTFAVYTKGGSETAVSQETSVAYATDAIIGFKVYAQGKKSGASVAGDSGNNPHRLLFNKPGR
jgi:hypothetical protein